MNPPRVRPTPERARSRVRVASCVCALALSALAVQGLAGGLTIVDDLFVGVWSPFGSRWEAESSVCVTGDGSFRVVATSVERGDRFALGNGAGDEVPYALFFRHRDRPGRGASLSPGVPSKKAVSGHPVTGCAGGANARVRVRVDRRAIDDAPPGIYADTLLLTLSPL